MAVDIRIMEELIAGALAGMKQVPEFSAQELLSACFTLTLRTMKAVKEGTPVEEMETNLAITRQAVEVLMLECADTSKQAN